MLCDVPASLLVNWITKPWPAGALRSVCWKAIPSAVSVSVAPPVEAEADPAADADGDPEAEGEVLVLNASCQQSGNGVASAAGLKFGSTQPLKVVSWPLLSSTGSLVVGLRTRNVWVFGALRKAIRSSI